MWFLGVILTAGFCRCAVNSPSRILLTRAIGEARGYLYSQLEKEGSVIQQRVEEGFESLFQALIESDRTDRELLQLSFFFKELGTLRMDSGFCLAEYLHLRPRDSSTRNHEKLAIDLLSVSNVNIFEFNGFLDPTRQPLMARLLKLASKMGLTRLELGVVFDRLDRLDDPALLEDELDLIEIQVEQFLSGTSADFSTLGLFNYLALGSYTRSISKGLFDFQSTLYRIRRNKPPLPLMNLSDRDEVRWRLIERIEEIKSEARIGIVPRLLELVERACTLNPEAPMLVAAIDISVRVCLDPSHFSMGSLAQFLVRIPIEYCVFVQTDEEYDDIVFKASIQVARRFGIDLLTEYPQIRPMWIQEKKESIQQIVNGLAFFGEGSRRLECSEAIVTSSLDRIVLASRVLSQMVDRTKRSVLEKRFHEVFLSSPKDWICDYFNDPSSTFAEWIISIHQQDGGGYPDRFVEMSWNILTLVDRARLNVFRELPSLEIAFTIALELPYLLIKKEVEWGMINQASDERLLLESTAIQYFDLLELISRMTLNDIPPQTVKALTRCAEDIMIVRNPAHLTKTSQDLASIGKSIQDGVDASASLCQQHLE